jgi:hypothetical protein
MTARKKAKTKASTSSTKSASKKATADTVSSLVVNLGHIFALRPRVETSFKPGNLNTAKHFFRDGSYSTIEDAARAVAEKALELTREGSGGRGSKSKRR